MSGWVCASGMGAFSDSKKGKWWLSMPCGKKKKRHKIKTHKRKKRLRADRHKKKPR
jgi:hypothetical protein